MTAYVRFGSLESRILRAVNQRFPAALLSPVDVEKFKGRREKQKYELNSEKIIRRFVPRYAGQERSTGPIGLSGKKGDSELKKKLCQLVSLSFLGPPYSAGGVPSAPACPGVPGQ